jgi:hypothetical protein
VDKQDTIAGQTLNAAEHLPLTIFFEALKKNGFPVTILQLSQANSLIIQYANQVKNETELCNYLSPLFASNEEEQVLFRQLFEKHFKIERPFVIKQNHPGAYKKPPPKWKWYIAGYGLLVVLVLAGLLMYQRNVTGSCPDVLPYQLAIALKEEGQPDTKKGAGVFIQKHTNEKVKLIPYIVTSKEISQKIRAGLLAVKTTYNWGDSSTNDTTSIHRYAAPGKYSVIANTSVYCSSNGSVIKKKTLYATVTVCSENNSLKITGPPNIDSVAPGKKIELVAVTGYGNKNETIYWYQDDSSVTGQGKKLKIAFNKPGVYKITCMAIFDSINSPCTLIQNIIITVPAIVEKEKGSFAPPDAFFPDDDAGPHAPYNPLLKPLYYTTISIFFILAIIFIALWDKVRRNTMRLTLSMLKQYEKLTGQEAGSSRPKQMPFKNKNYLPVQEPEIKQVALQMRKRVNDTISFINIDKTVKRSIENGGLFQPVHDARTRQTEYLFLVQQATENSQYVKLVEYLAAMLKRQNVLIETYYYPDAPMQCFNDNNPEGLSLEKLSKKYCNHILLIFGDGQQLVNSSLHNFDSVYAELLNRWQHRAIVTPVSFTDWGVAEKEVLMPEIPVFPADIPGLLLLLEMLNSMEHNTDIMPRLRQNKAVFYSTTGIDFEDIDALEKYCESAAWAGKVENGKPVNVLLQWIAAMAVYPKPQWELTLAIGRAMFEKYNMPAALNYTSLLRIIRISWMGEGNFPDGIRLALLKKLTVENELLARETVLSLLKEIPAGEFADNPAAQAEKEIQQVVNEFSLYASDPAFYTGYRESGYLFEKLWNENRIIDAVLKTYFSNEANEWQTPVNKRDIDNGIVRNTAIEEYFESKNEEESIMARLYLYCGIVSIAGFVFSLFALLILWRQWGNG